MKMRMSHHRRVSHVAARLYLVFCHLSSGVSKQRADRLRGAPPATAGTARSRPRASTGPPIRSVDEESFPGVNSWFLASIPPRRDEHEDVHRHAHRPAGDAGLQTELRCRRTRARTLHSRDADHGSRGTERNPAIRRGLRATGVAGRAADL